jgi:hypothetical protein
VGGDLNVLALIKGEEFYIYVYDDGGVQLLVDALRRQAANPELTFSWFDAAVLGDRARAQAKDRQPALPATRLVL